MAVSDYRIIQRREKCYNPYVVEKNDGWFFPKWGYDAAYSTYAEAKLYVLDKTKPNVINEFSIGT